MCRSDDALYRSTVLPVVLMADQHSHDEKCVNWNEAAIRELITIRAEAEIVRQFSEMVRGALYKSHGMSRVFTGSLRVVCEGTHRFPKITGSVNEPKSDHPGTNHGTHFPEWLCERGFSGKIVGWKLCAKFAKSFSQNNNNNNKDVFIVYYV